MANMMETVAGKMRECGFPQQILQGDLYLCAGQLYRASQPIAQPPASILKVPMVDEIILVLGTDFSSIMRLSNEEWVARSPHGRSATGRSPAEATGRLYVLMNAKKK